MPEELKPCPNPKCGKMACLNVIDASGLSNIFCPSCEMTGPVEISEAAAITAWNSLPRAPHITPNDVDCKGCPERRPGLAWTKEPPKVPGWYWYQRCFSRPRIAQVKARGLGMIAIFAGNEEDEWVEDMVAFWAGPIPGPEESDQ